MKSPSTIRWLVVSAGWTPAWIQTRCLPASGTVLSVHSTFWIGRPCCEVPRLTTLRTRGSPARFAISASFRLTVYGKNLATRIATTPGGTVTLNRCCVPPWTVGTALVGMRV